MFMFLSVLALCFLSEITLFAIFDNVIRLVVPATNPTQQNTFHLQQPNNNSPFTCAKKTKQPYVVSHETKHKKHCTHAALSKQFKFIIPGICYTAPLK